MDINMPDMDGIAATERLAAEVPTAAVVMMSVQGEADYLRRSMLAGAREFLVKPFSSDELTVLDPAGLHARAREAVADRASSPRPARQRGQAGREAPDGDDAGAGPDRRRVRSQGRRRPHHARRQPGRRRRHGARPADVPRRRLVPVRRRGRPAQPQPQEQVDRRPHPGARGRGARVARHLPHQPLSGDPRAAGSALPRDGRADHAVGDQAHARGAARHARPRGRGLHVLVQRHHPGHPRHRPTPS